VRTSYEKAKGFLYLDPPHPKRDDFEWGLRMMIDKYFFLADNPEVEDFGCGSNGLCLAAGNQSNKDNPCGNCPIKIKTGESNCEATPLKFVDIIVTFDERKSIYEEMLGLVENLYKELYGQEYKSEIKEEKSAIILQQKNKPLAGSPGSPVCSI
jgi:hypothetical protein